MMNTLHASILSLCAKENLRRMLQMQKEQGGYRAVRWGEYREKTLKIASFLRAQGIMRGDRVLLISENAPEWTMAALAVMNLGAVVVPVASIASYLEIQNILREANPKFCFVSNRCTAAKQLEKEYAIPHLFWDLQEGEPLKEIWDKYPADLLNTFGTGEETAILIFTSGTTGTPKAVPISHKNILTNARDAIEEIEANHKDRLVSVLPLSHMFEFTGGFVTPMLIAAEVTYVKSLKAEDLLQAMRDTKATIMLSVPLLFEIIGRNLQSRLQEAPDFLQKIFKTFERIVRKYPFFGPYLFYPVHKAFGAHIRYFMAGGSRLQPAVYDFFKGLGITILQGYGLTETSPVLSVTNLHNSAPDHVGRVLKHVELGIFNDKGEPLATGVEGEIWARGPSIFKGYLNPEHSQGVFWGDWFRTGDLGTLDAAGILRITGRKKDIIVTSAGKNVYPEEIEGIVFESGKFLEVCVLGMQDSSGHEKICLVLVPDKVKFLGKSPAEMVKESTALAVELCRTLSDYKWPQKVEVLFEELPKTSTRKIKKHEVKKILLNRTSAAGATGSSAEQGKCLSMDDALEHILAESISSITKMEPTKIPKNASLTKDLGLDSLTFVEIVSAVEKKFSAPIEGIEFTAINTIDDLLTLISAQLGSRRRKAFFQKTFFVEFHPFANKRLCWSLPRRILNTILRVYLKLRHKMEVHGLENLDPKASYILTPNHASHFDTMSIMGSIPARNIHLTFAVAAKDYFFNKSWKALIARSFINAIPFDRKGRVDESMNKCREVLVAGGSLVIFPEGTRSPDGKVQEFKAGVGQLLASHAKAMAVPVYIDGAYAILPKGRRTPGPGKLRLYFGKPISFQHLKREPESYKKIAEELQKQVKALEILAHRSH